MENWKDIHQGFTGKVYYTDGTDKNYQQYWEEQSLTYQDAQEWISVGLEPYNYEFALYLKQNNVTAEQYAHYKKNKTPQKQLDYLYANKNQVEWINLTNLNFNQPSELILDNFPNLKGIYGSIIPHLTQLTITNCPQLEKIDINSLWNNQQLTLNNLPNLNEITCFNNNLSALDLSNFDNLQWIYCQYNQLTQIKLPQGGKLEYLDLHHNNLNQDLSFLSDLVNLNYLSLSSNSLYGSLEFLSGMNKLETLYVDDTDIDSGLEYLPENVEDFWCLAKKRPEAKVKAIYDLFADERGIVEADKYGIKNFPQKLKDLKNSWTSLGFAEKEMKTWARAGAKLNDAEFVNWLKNTKNYGSEWITNYKDEYQILSKRFKKHGLCSECNQPNTGEQWCQPCNKSHLQQVQANNNSKINKFILKYQLEATEANKFIEWIPYEQFSDIEYLAEGGFGKVYKAKWIEGNIHHWDNEKKQWQREKDHREIVLKSLYNSSTNTDFLQETEKHKIIDDWFNNIVPCYGLSQNSETGNYLMVMKYIEGGNLRKYLKDKNLSFKDKLLRLVNIAQGLKDIHHKNLIHRDFHSGNILNNDIHSFITDLGLCKPANETSKEDEIFGVMPYVAPEVLRKKGYASASDIYSWGMVAYELISGFPPYPDLPHDNCLAIEVCKGLRPRFEVKIPSLLKDLIERCWDADPTKRPTANELNRILNNWVGEINSQKNTEFFQQFKEREQFLDKLTSLDYEIHPSAFYTSRRLDFKNLPEPQNSKEVNDIFYKSRQDDLTLGFTQFDLQEVQEETYQEQQAQILQPTYGTPGSSNSNK